MQRIIKVFKYLILSLFIGVSITLSAQPGGGRPCPKPPCPPPVPITGIEYLLGLGGLYGIKKLITDQKKKTSR
ncbi:MAG: hypothetical protein JST69_00580 [Bacteroidetes bacterium]|nr:hypothetical protein [Bacteroidota bacterium]